MDELSADQFFADELGPPVTPDELSANFYLWLALGEEGWWQWYADLSMGEEIPGV